MQEATSVRSPSISTMQARQLPSGDSPAGLWHRCGSVLPLALGHLPDRLALLCGDELAVE